jgi:hypothetical protein
MWSSVRAVFGGNDDDSADRPRELDTSQLNFKATGVLTLVKGLYTTGMLTKEDLERAQDVIATNL